MTSEAQRELAARIRADRQVWRDLVAEVGRDRMLEPGPMGDWTFKDMAAHLAAWRNARIPMIEAIGRGEPIPPPPWPAELDDDDPINAWFRERDRDKPLDDVIADYDASFERLAAAIESLPDAVAHDPQCAAVGRRHASGRHRLHGPPARRAPAGRPQVACGS
jgi:hypothetical protein